MVGTFWSLVPAVVAIALALLTKEVYFSLFVGIIIGAVFYAGADFPALLDHLFKDGMIAQLTNSYNAGILVFLVVLGIMVALVNKAGGSAAFGDWAKKHIKTRVGAQLATIFLGILIFIDDYFNCLTVGSVMRPVTDKYKVSREKLAYLIDATAAPVCIIAPISSWAAAVSDFVQGDENGLALFMKAIPYNYYAIFTIVFMIVLVLLNVDFGPMSKAEAVLEDAVEEVAARDGTGGKGKVFDLVFPIICLIIFCTLGMIYSGGFFTEMVANDEGVMEANGSYLNFVDAFANSDASVGLVLGSFAALIVTLLAYITRRIISLKDCMECVPEGFKAMVPAILILTLAWTLKGMTDSLGAKQFVADVVNGGASSFMGFLPAIIFVIAALLAFATGTSWGTFGILIPICIAVFPDVADPLRVISISACMAGAVCGDHISPISDTTIMASAGAQCEHVRHVATQIPYAMIVAAISFITYIIAGFVKNPIVPLLTGLLMLIGACILIKRIKEQN